MNSIETVDVDDRDLQMYVTEPESGDHPGVLLVHAWWGLNECFRALCDRLARESFLVVAPDLYDGDVASTIEEAEALSSALDQTEATTDVSAAFDFLRDHENVAGGLGVTGVSMGVGYALWVVRNRANAVDATVLFYGNGGGEYADTSTAFLGHFAEHDVEALRERLQAGDGAVTFHTYPNTEHWFFESDRPEYDEEAAQLAWSRTVEFLRTEL
jgi:carboxymethylenebutenolidase